MKRVGKLARRLLPRRVEEIRANFRAVRMQSPRAAKCVNRFSMARLTHQQIGQPTPRRAAVRVCNQRLPVSHFRPNRVAQFRGQIAQLYEK